MLSSSSAKDAFAASTWILVNAVIIVENPDGARRTL